MMKKNRFIVACMICTLCVIAISCQAEPALPDPGPENENTVPDDGTLVSASIVIEDDKGVSITVPDGVAKRQYRAIPLFSIEGDEADGKIFGEQLTWRNFKTDDEGKFANLGWYRQGYWQFEIRTLNKNGQVLMTGSTKETGNVYLQKGKDNVINITLHPDDGEGRAGENESTGKIMFAFETNWLSNSLDDTYIRLEVDKLTIHGKVDERIGFHDTMFPLKGGTQEATPAGKGWEKFYDVNHVGTPLVSDGPADSRTMPVVVGYADAWKTVAPGAQDTGLLASEAGKKLGFKAVVPQGRIRYYAETPDLQEVPGKGYGDNGEEIDITLYKGGITPGSYLVRAKVCTVGADGNEIVIGGQSMAVKVVGGETTTVIGSLLQEKYISTGLSITIPENVNGELTKAPDGEEGFVIKSNTLNEETTISLTYAPDNHTLTDGDLTYNWYVNGEHISGANSKSYILQPTKYGDHKVTCVVHGKAGDTDFLGEIGSATIVVRVVEASGPNI